MFVKVEGSDVFLTVIYVIECMPSGEQSVGLQGLNNAAMIFYAMSVIPDGIAVEVSCYGCGLVNEMIIPRNKIVEIFNIVWFMRPNA